MRLATTMPDRHEFSSNEFNLQEDAQITIEYPVDTKEQLLSFEIVPLSDCEFSGGAFYGSYEDKDIRDITLCLTTTTCKKEEFIKKNVRLLKDELFAEGSEMRDSFYIHVVDNGRTLSKEEIEGFHVTLHPNKNVGGSGGFARGMIESMRQSPQATHMLLMDDDVLVLPESIRRTYTLLKVLKDEWKDAFISGAMLEMETKFIQRDNLAIFSNDCLFCSVQPISDQNLLENVLTNNLEIPHAKGVYAAWWYCCIPVKTIKQNGLPMPFFVRGDDVEFGLRSKAKCISMTGFCVWHMGFANKYNPVMDLYQVFRNILIAASIHSDLDARVQFKVLRSFFIKNLYGFAYDSAQLLCLALEDFMKGPEFIEQDNGEIILKDRSQLNEKFVPLSNLNLSTPLHLLMSDNGLSFYKRFLYRLTANFQRFVPAFLLKKTTGAVLYGGESFPERQYKRSSLLVVNRFSRAGTIRNKDKRKFKKLMRRFYWDTLLFKLKRKKLATDYAAKREWLTSEEFWKKYLEI